MQIQSTITMADTVLDFLMDDEGTVEWFATDSLTGESISGKVTDKQGLFFKAVYIALSGDDECITTLKYAEMERLLGFIGTDAKHPARWIP